MNALRCEYIFLRSFSQKNTKLLVLLLTLINIILMIEKIFVNKI